MSLPWIKVYADLPDHPRAVDLGDLLGSPLAWAHLVSLWTHCARYDADGIVRGMAPDRAVERAARWTGEPGAFVRAAEATRWIARVKDGWSVVGWVEHQKSHLDKMERDRVRAAERRASEKAAVEESRDGRATVAGLSRDGSETVARRSQSVAGEKEKEKEIEKYKSTVAADAPTPPDATPDSTSEHDREEPTAREAASLPRGATNDTPNGTTPHPAPDDAPESKCGGLTLTPAPADPRTVREEQITAVLRHWQRAVERPRWAIEGKAATKRRARVRARLDEGFSVADLCAAADHVRNDPWLWGTKPGAPAGGYRDVETVFRDAAQVERLRDLTTAPERPAGRPTYDNSIWDGVQTGWDGLDPLEPNGGANA